MMQQIKERTGFKFIRLDGVSDNGVPIYTSFSLAIVSGGAFDFLYYKPNEWIERQEGFGPYCLFKTITQAEREGMRHHRKGFDYGPFWECLYIRSRDKCVWCPSLQKDGMLISNISSMEELPPGTVLADRFNNLRQEVPHLL